MKSTSHETTESGEYQTDLGRLDSARLGTIRLSPAVWRYIEEVCGETQALTNDWPTVHTHTSPRCDGVVPQPHCQFVPRLGLCNPQRLLDVKERACCRVPKAMHAAAMMDLQSVAALAHDAFKTVFPLEPVRAIQSGKPVAVLLSLREYERLTTGMQDFRGTYAAFTANVDLSELSIDPQHFTRRPRPLNRTQGGPVSTKYLLDTNIVSEPLCPAPNAKVLARLKRHSGELAITSLVWHELWLGCQRLPVSTKRAVIERYLNEVVAESMPILSYDQAAAEWHAAERVRLTALGQTPPFVDGR